MAQKNGSRTGSGAPAKKPVSTARTLGAAKKTGAAQGGGRQPSSGGGRSGTSRPAASGASRPARPAGPDPLLRRTIGAFVLLFFGLVGVISWFPAQGWLLDLFRKLLRGLFGWGYAIAPLCLLWGMGILWVGRRSRGWRLACVLLLPLVFGAFVHIGWCARDGLFTSGFSYGMKQLWLLAQDAQEHAGGVIAGSLGILLRRMLSRFGAYIVLVLAFALMALEGANITPTELWERLRADLERLAEETSEEDDVLDEDDPAAAGKPPVPRRPEPKRPRPAEGKKGGRRPYDEGWEQEKDYIFAAMGVDKGAELRVAAAVEDERRARRRHRPTAKPSAEKRPREPEKTVREQEKAVREPEKTARPAADKPAGPDMTKVAPLSVEEAADIAGVEIHSADLDEGAASPAPKKEKIDRDAEAAAVAEEIAAAEEDKPEYIFPELSLLHRSDPRETAGSQSDDENETRLESAIRSFGVGATITGAIHGPTVTRYELLLDQGVKLSKITNLQNDIALSIGVTSVRIAPIPGRISTVGVEVPNRVKQTVWLGDVIDSEVFRSAKSKLSVAMGKDIGGNVIVGNIAKMPHVLIAGTTGSGKSVCINSLILSILYKSTPDEVRMIMVDPKQVELGIYNGMPHLYVPVVTDAKKAAGALQWSVVEMLKRYRLFSEVGVRDLAGYNAVLRQNDQPTLPQVVIIIDELADLMMVAAKEVEESICRVAQMGRAAGMHLVVATQSPRADVITGLMKANIPSRIAFAVSSALESRIILDQQGAEKLVGQGDMLYSPIGIGKPLRVQGAFVTDEEREEIIEFIKREAEAEYSDEILAEIEKAAAADDKKGGKNEEDEPAGRSEYDELLPQAVDVIFETKQASVSMLQRRLKLGYSRAARLIDQLEEVGVVGPYEGSKPRTILLTKQQWQEMQYSQGTAPVDTIAQEFAAVAGDESFAAPADDEDEPEGVGEAAADADDAPWGEDDE